jgi:hypothetical protein
MSDLTVNVGVDKKNKVIHFDESMLKFDPVFLKYMMEYKQLPMDYAISFNDGLFVNISVFIALKENFSNGKKQ